jgi:hypothetical protein
MLAAVLEQNGGSYEPPFPFFVHLRARTAIKLFFT